MRFCGRGRQVVWAAYHMDVGKWRFGEPYAKGTAQIHAQTLPGAEDTADDSAGRGTGGWRTDGAGSHSHFDSRHLTLDPEPRPWRRLARSPGLADRVWSIVVELSDPAT